MIIRNKFLLLSFSLMSLLVAAGCSNSNGVSETNGGTTKESAPPSATESGSAGNQTTVSRQQAGDIATDDPSAKEQILIEKQPLQSKDKYIVYDNGASLIQLSGMSNTAVQNKINSALHDTAESDYQDLLDYVQDRMPEMLANREKWKDYGAEDESYFYGHIDVQYEVTYQNDHIISILANGLARALPEVHPARLRHAFVFDLATGERLKIKDALNRSDELKDRFTELTRKLIGQGKLLPEEAGIPSANEGPQMNDPDSYDYYVQKKDGTKVMTIYEETSHVIGYYELDLAPQDLGELKDSNSPIWQ